MKKIAFGFILLALYKLTNSMIKTANLIIIIAYIVIIIILFLWKCLIQRQCWCTVSLNEWADLSRCSQSRRSRAATACSLDWRTSAAAPQTQGSVLGRAGTALADGTDTQGGTAWPRSTGGSPTPWSPSALLCHQCLKHPAESSVGKLVILYSSQD